VSFKVSLTREALEDLERLEAFLVELAFRHRDFDLPLRAMDAIQREMRILQTNPYTAQERELVIPFGSSGYVALFEIISEHEVVISAMRHQREDDYH
jgi:plasmid stabilization system protein ParE